CAAARSSARLGFYARVGELANRVPRLTGSSRGAYFACSIGGVRWWKPRRRAQRPTSSSPKRPVVAAARARSAPATQDAWWMGSAAWVTVIFVLPLAAYVPAPPPASLG